MPPKNRSVPPQDDGDKAKSLSPPAPPAPPPAPPTAPAPAPAPTPVPIPSPLVVIDNIPFFVVVVVALIPVMPRGVVAVAFVPVVVVVIAAAPVAVTAVAVVVVVTAAPVPTCAIVVGGVFVPPTTPGLVFSLENCLGRSSRV